jgi:fatty acid desaturase
MDILKTAHEWAKVELVTTKIFMLFGIVFIAIGTGFWLLGKSDVARSFIWPQIVVGVLLLTVGVGLHVAYLNRMNGYLDAFNKDVLSFVQSEIDYANKTIASYEGTVFKVIPLIVAFASILIVFIHQPIWRAICISTIAMMTVIMTIDGTANARMKEYKQQMEEAQLSLS